MKEVEKARLHGTIERNGTIEPHSSTSGLSLAVNQILLGDYLLNKGKNFMKSLTKTRTT